MLTNTKKGLQYADVVILLSNYGVHGSMLSRALAELDRDIFALAGIDAILTQDDSSLYELFQEAFHRETDSRSPLMLSIDVDVLSEDELQEELNGDLPSLGQWVTHREFGSLECTARVVEKVAGRNVLIFQFEKGLAGC